MRYRNENVEVPLLEIDRPYTKLYDSKDFTTGYYGIMIRTDYTTVGSSYGDVYLGYKMGSSSLSPRFSLIFNGGVYTDYGFVDKLIKDLPTMSFKGYNWYYYYFTTSVVTPPVYLSYYGNSPYRLNSDGSYEKYVRFILEPKNN